MTRRTHRTLLTGCALAGWCFFYAAPPASAQDEVPPPTEPQAVPEEPAPRPVDLPPFGPTPTENQLRWHDERFYAFVHFGPNTYTGVEWGAGQENPDLFRPKELDARQWARAFKAAGMTGIIITAKHHDGFCLWPSDVTDHDVASSSWLDGKGDVLQALSDACAAEGLWMGVYLSPWDRTEETYGTGDAYNEHFRAQLQEALTRYGPIREVWFDGANGEGPNGNRQEYDWPLFVAEVRKHQPGAVIFSDAGPDVRWCGNERAVGGVTNWATLRRDEIAIGTGKTDELNSGHRGGTHWLPAECNTSIRPGWFWRAGMDAEVKDLNTLLDTWYASVGRGGNFLLNVPPDARGLLPDVDVERLALLGNVIERTHRTDLLRAAVQRGGAVHAASNVRADSATMDPTGLLDPKRTSFWSVDDAHDADGQSLAWVEFKLADPVTFDEVWLEEPIQLGQRVARFRVLVEEEEDGKSRWREVAAGTTIGPQRALRIPETTARRIRVAVDEALATPALSRLALFLSPPTVRIDPPGQTSVNPVTVALSSRPGTTIRYTLDGSEVTADSPLYGDSLTIAAAATLQAAAFDGEGMSPFLAEASYRVVPESEWKAGIQFVKSPDSGLRAAQYEGGWQTLDQMDEKEPLATAKVAGFDPKAASRAEQFAVKYTGYVQVPKDGLYTFAVTSDDGSRLYVHGELLVDNDGLHGMVREEGRVALRAGYHPIELRWFNARGGKGLEVTWSGPGVGKEAPVPAGVLFR